MKEQIGNKILSNTKVYMGYEVFEVVLIIAVAILQVVYLTKLLQGGSIVWWHSYIPIIKQFIEQVKDVLCPAYWKTLRMFNEAVHISWGG